MSDYIHGSEPSEQARLARLNELINSRCLSLLQLQPGERAIDIGSGLGQLTLAMAQQVGPKGVCLGIERDENQIREAKKNLAAVRMPWVEFRQGNAEELKLLDSELGSFDLAHARFVVEHVRNPIAVVEGMVKSVRKGGRVVLEDDDHEGFMLYPESEGFVFLWKAYIHSYEKLGNDPRVGRKLVSLLYRAGLRDISNTVVFFGDNASSPQFTAFVENLIGILNGVRDLLVTEKLVSADQFDTTIAHLRQWSLRPDAAMWYTINWAMGRRI